ncbi:MAG: beta-ribofuranosylaminobenzene 5'-phosphate synthase [Zoogloeaceae bacterium]|nr:beta-ribofuranosylaminobenzene 5'-phosphate synthase [Zoogloeaceae bacterium]
MNRLERPARGEDGISVEAPARLHLGFLDPSASLGRRFASLGLVIDGFSTRVSIAAAQENTVLVDPGCSACDRARLERHLEALQTASGFEEPVMLRLHHAPPAHAGFGSGTQLALAAGRAFSEFHGLDIPTRSIAAMLGRGERSGVGIAGFDQGGLLLDGGPGRNGSAAPLLARVSFPGAWRVVLVLDGRIDGLCGSAERVAMERLPPFPRDLAADLCQQVLMRVLPGAIEQDFEPFAEGVSTIQSLIGAYFAPAQGGSMYTSEAVATVLDWMHARYCAGVGQSSWGPTGFMFTRSEEEAERAIAAARADGVVDPALELVVVGGNNRGALVRSHAAVLAQV